MVTNYCAESNVIVCLILHSFVCVQLSVTRMAFSRVHTSTKADWSPLFQSTPIPNQTQPCSHNAAKTVTVKQLPGKSIGHWV